MKVGDQFGRWTVLVPLAGGPRARCVCACGLERLVPRNNLTSGMSRGCTACRAEAQRGPRNRYAADSKIGFWVVVSDQEAVSSERRSERRWITVRCSACERTHVLCLVTVRKTARDHKACAQCRYEKRVAGYVSTVDAVRMTGISRQGIHARVKRSWTIAEAQTLPGGVRRTRAGK